MYVIVCFGVTQSAGAAKQITEQAESNPTNDKGLCKKLSVNFFILHRRFSRSLECSCSDIVFQ